MIRPWTQALLVAILPVAAAAAGKELAPPPLTAEHLHPSGAFTYRTPPTWTVTVAPTNPNAIETSGDGLKVRFIFREGESGFDSLHVDCMLERLAGAMDQDPRVKYEYDFISGTLGERRGLDSAFIVKYDAPIGGYTEWRQRNVTLVGAGQSLCAISYAPLPVWKKSKPARALLDAVLGSVVFKK